MLSPVTINLKDFTKQSFAADHHRSLHLAYEQAVSNAHAKRSDSNFALLQFSKREALRIHMDRLECVLGQTVGKNVSTITAALI